MTFNNDDLQLLDDMLILGIEHAEQKQLSAEQITHRAHIRQWVMELATRAVIGKPTTLRRLRLPLNNYNSDLLLVGDTFEQGGRYVRLEVKRTVSERWSWLEWDEQYDLLAREWGRRYQPTEQQAHDARIMDVITRSKATPKPTETTNDVDTDNA